MSCRFFFFDEFIVGVDVELCCDMWNMVWCLCECGVIIIFIIYYIEEVEEMVDCIGYKGVFGFGCTIGGLLGAVLFDEGVFVGVAVDVVLL